MTDFDGTVAVFSDHSAAEAAIKRLVSSGFEMTNLSVVGKGFHSEETVVGFYNTGDRIKFWGAQGAFWGGFWGLFFGGVFVAVPLVGQVIVLGYLATAVIAAVEGAVVFGGLSALGAALVSIGIPENSVIQYEAALKADGFLVMVHGSSAEVLRAKVVLGTDNPLSIDVHGGAKPVAAMQEPVPVM